MTSIEELFKNPTLITPEEVQAGDWVAIDSRRGIVVHRVYEVQLNDGNYDIRLFNVSPEMEVDSLVGTEMYLVRREPIPYEIAPGALMVVTTSKFTAETLVVRSPQNYWMVIDKGYPLNFTETVYDVDIITFREYDEEVALP